MNNRAVDIELCNEDRNVNILEEESSKEGGVLHESTATSKWPKMDQILQLHDKHPSKRFLKNWKIIFIVSSSLAVFIDPLVCYVPVVLPGSTCYYWHQKFIWTVFGLRTFLDLFYAMNVYLRRHHDTGKAKSYVAPLAKLFGERKMKRLNEEKSLRILRSIPRICAAMPTLQAVIIAGKYAHHDKSRFIYLLSLQYILRAHSVYRWLSRHSNVDTAISRLLKACLDFLPFFLAAHLFGALWYLSSFDRHLVCWQEYVCKANRICGHETLDSFFFCSSATPKNNLKFNMSLLRKACDVKPSEDVPALPFNYGIYEYGLQSEMTKSTNLLTKILQCFWWGLRNLSSSGSNLLTSFSWSEIVFSVVISITGLALFLVYLNSTVQGWKSISEHLKLRKKKETVYAEKVNEMRNMNRLRLAALKKVLKGKNVKLVKAMSMHPKLVHETYCNDACIIREGQPLRKMVFITRGTLLAYTESKDGICVCEWLKTSDYYGEELLKWVFKSASWSELPVSTRTVVAQTKVEAFTIAPKDLTSIVTEFWWHFKREMDVSELEQFAASSLQRAWRSYMQRKRSMGRVIN